MTALKILKLTVMFLLLVFILAVGIFVYAVESSSQSHRLNDTNTSSYLEHSEAIKVTNNCGKDIFIPANTSAEWESFNTSAHSCIARTTDFVECGSMTSSQQCTGSVVASLGNPGSAAACVALCDAEADGTCCEYDTVKVVDCEMFDGSASIGTVQAASCTDYD